MTDTKTNMVIRLSNLGRRFPSDPPVNALVDINLEVDYGDWISITGPSGSGKSTLLNVIGCLDRQTSGDYFFNNTDTGILTDSQRAGLRSRRIGFVFQAFYLLSYRSVVENVMLGEIYQHTSSRGRLERAREALNRVDMLKRADFLPTHISGGERQRVAIARALMGKPDLLLCDEPTGNLDSKSTTMILDLFEIIHASGQTIIMVTHEQPVAERARKKIEMIDGEIVCRS